MNRARHRVYLLQMDVWEPFTKVADIEVDKVVQFVKNNLSHCGNVKISLESEELL
jgi:hypothetical protein